MGTPTELLPFRAQIMRIQKTLGITVDGDPRAKTWNAIEAAIVPAKPMPAPIPEEVPGLRSHPEAVALILEFEGLDQPSKWPKGASGITLGHGYDLRFHTRTEFRRDWGKHLTADQLAELEEACGKSPAWASAFAPRFGSIRITKEAAREVFNRTTMPRWEETTAKTFQTQGLSSRCFGALVSLCFNRGTDMADDPKDSQHDRRREMRQIRDALRNGKPELVSNAILGMRRLWLGTDVPGLVRRREAEAALFERGLA